MIKYEIEDGDIKTLEVAGDIAELATDITLLVKIIGKRLMSTNEVLGELFESYFKNEGGIQRFAFEECEKRGG